METLCLKSGNCGITQAIQETQTVRCDASQVSHRHTVTPSHLHRMADMKINVWRYNLELSIRKRKRRVVRLRAWIIDDKNTVTMGKRPFTFRF